MYLYIVITVIALLFIVAFYVVWHFRYRKQTTTPKKFGRGNPTKINGTMAFDEQIDLLPYDESYEFPQKKLALGRRLGKGSFGVVIEAVAQGILPHEAETTVIVKIINSAHDKEVTSQCGPIAIVAHVRHCCI